MALQKIKLNHKKWVLTLFGLCLIIALGAFYKKYITNIDYKEIVVPSGLKILFVNDSSLPYIAFNLTVMRSGSDYDYPNKQGLAQITGEFLDQGAGGLNAQQIQEKLNYYGTIFTVGIGRQSSEFSLTGLSWHSKELWDLFTKITTEPHFDSQEFQLFKKRKLVQRIRALDRPSSMAFEAFRKSIFSETSIGHPKGGNKTSLKNINLEDVKEFFHNQYQPQYSVLTVVGQLNKEIEAEILSFYQNQEVSQKEIPRTSFKDTNQSSFSLVTREDQVQSQVIIGFPISPFPSQNPSEFLAINLVNDILGGGGFESRLMDTLREKMGLTYSVFSHFSFGSSYGMFFIKGDTRTNATAQFLSEALRIYKEIRQGDIDKNKFDTFKLKEKSSYLLSIETPRNRLGKFVYYTHQLGADPQFTPNYLSYLDKVTLEDAKQAIDTYLKGRNLHIVVYGHPDAEKILSQVEGLPPLKVIPFEEYFAEDMQ